MIRGLKMTGDYELKGEEERIRRRSESTISKEGKKKKSRKREEERGIKGSMRTILCKG